jgi:DNA polymerase III delta prime subunit
MRLGDLLVRAKRVTEQDVQNALDRGRQVGGRLGDNLVAIGAIDQRTLSSFLNRIPTEPHDIAATNIEDTELIALLMKLIYTGRLETVRQYISAIKLPYHIVSDLVKMALDRQFLHTLGTRKSDNLLDMAYALTEEGRRWCMAAMERMSYAGPAPVTLEEFNYQVILQKPTNEVITALRIDQAIGDLEMDRAIMEQIGPALNSGRAILLYGPPGNGKTTVALRFVSVFHDVIYIPYSVAVEGQIIRVFDASVHTAVEQSQSDEESQSFVRSDSYDARWVPCRRPFVTVGGELTLEMLDLRYDVTGHFYEAPMHMKALGGCFFIDDFGRQLVSPASLLNRWIVPLENRFDFLKLHTGKSFRIPFEELVIFSTNLEPEDLMDPAFLRRLPYKIEVGPPDIGRYRRIFEAECTKQGFAVPEEVFNYIVYKLKNDKGMDLATYQPKFIVDQIVAICKFEESLPHFEPRFIDYALDNLRVRRAPAAGGGSQVTSKFRVEVEKSVQALL